MKMPRNYFRKTNRQGWSKDNLEKAVDCVQRKESSVNQAAKKYQIPEPTLRRYLKKYPDRTFPQNAGRFKNTFTEAQLIELKNYVTQIDQRGFGLTKGQLGEIVFRFAEDQGIAHRFNSVNRTAGRDWVERFIKNSNLTLRKPEATSTARLVAFNRKNVESFYTLLKELRRKFQFKPNQIYNIDESGFSTVPTKQPKVVTPKGNRRVIKLSSGERGMNVTAVCGMNAAGSYIPPFFIFPRKRMQPSYMHGAPPGSTGVAHDTGWMTTENFLLFLQHFARFACPSADNPILLLMDNHASHVNLPAINFCRENHIDILGFPPHTTHKLQPLDVAFYGPLKTAYSRCCDNFMTSHPGQNITLHDVAQLVGQAFLKVASAGTAINGFRATGIEPFDPEIFRDEDYEPSKTTDRDEAIATVVKIPEPIDKDSISTLHSVSVASNNHTENLTIVPGPSTSQASFPPLPIAKKRTTRQRKKLPSLILSSTPVKRYLQKREKEKQNKEEKKKLRQEKLKEKALHKDTKGKSKKPVKKKLSFSDSEESENEDEIIYAETDDDMDFDLEDNECAICGETGKTELWYQCTACKQWVHAACSGWEASKAKTDCYICDFCIE